VEWETKFVEIAKGLLAERKIKNVRVIAGDATSTGLAEHSFQFVHERLLLIVTPEPTKVISEMVRLAEPGGIVAVEDVDIGMWTCEPPHHAWARLFAAFEDLYTRDGKDLRVGRRLPGLLRAAGLDKVACKAHARLNVPGDFHQQQLLVFVKQFWRQIIDLGLIGQEELASLFQQLEAHLADPATLVVSPLLFQAWGYKKQDKLGQDG
jgi:SAM-dependent methyltransferase